MKYSVHINFTVSRRYIVDVPSRDHAAQAAWKHWDKEAYPPLPDGYEAIDNTAILTSVERIEHDEEAQRSRITKFTPVHLDTVEKAIAFLQLLHSLDMLWHLDEDPEECFPCLSLEDCEILRQAAKQMHRLHKVTGWDPFGYIIDKLKAFES